MDAAEVPEGHGTLAEIHDQRSPPAMSQQHDDGVVPKGAVEDGVEIRRDAPRVDLPAAVASACRVLAHTYAHLTAALHAHAASTVTSMPALDWHHDLPAHDSALAPDSEHHNAAFGDHVPTSQHAKEATSAGRKRPRASLDDSLTQLIAQFAPHDDFVPSHAGPRPSSVGLESAEEGRTHALTHTSEDVPGERPASAATGSSGVQGATGNPSALQLSPAGLVSGQPLQSSASLAHGITHTHKPTAADAQRLEVEQPPQTMLHTDIRDDVERVTPSDQVLSSADAVHMLNEHVQCLTASLEEKSTVIRQLRASVQELLDDNVALLERACVAEEQQKRLTACEQANIELAVLARCAGVIALCSPAAATQTEPEDRGDGRSAAAVVEAAVQTEDPVDEAPRRRAEDLEQQLQQQQELHAEQLMMQEVVWAQRCATLRAELARLRAAMPVPLPVQEGL